MIYNLNVSDVPKLNQVGGKAKALIETTKAGFPVPEGIALSVEFIQPWLDEVKSSDEWKAALKDTTKDACDAVKEKATNMTFTVDMKMAFETGMKSLSGDVFAVRSSSPEEDLEGTSFAGMYETSLGVLRGGIEKAIAHAFSSCFDFRVMEYKKQNGMTLDNTCIAVVIQRQIDSDVSGVGFSINPINNDYDNVVINSSFGLGESVVSGIVSPDQFTIDSVKNEIVKKIKGKHELKIELRAGGGIVQQKSKQEDFSLNDEKVIDIVKCIKEIENFYGFPVDVEWAYKDDKLYILQSRPITAYFSLDKHLMTNPEEKRMLYMDVNLVDGITSNVPILPLTMDWYYDAFLMYTGPILGGVKVDGHLPARDALFFCGNGRVYLNVSQILHLTKMDQLGGMGEQADQRFAEITKSIDSKIYTVEKPLSYLRMGFILRKSPIWTWRSRKLIAKTIKAYFRPKKFFANEFKPKIDNVINKLKSDIYDDIPLTKMTEKINSDLDNALFTYGFAAIIPLMMAMDKIPKIVKDGSEEMDELADAIFLGTENNETIDMGIAMYRMANMLDKSEFDDLDVLAKKIQDRKLDDDFLSCWDSFIRAYQFRGPNELELKNGRYGDDAKIALLQMSYMVGSEYNPEESNKKNIEIREEAYKKICEKLKGRKLKQFKTNYNIARSTSEVRDTPKYIWMLGNGLVRKRALKEGSEFVSQGLLDNKEDIFLLYYSEIEKAQSKVSIDLKKIVKDRKRKYKQLDQIVSYPILVDSRGFIPSAVVTEVNDDVLSGHGISRGIAVGKIKVLKYADEKPIEKGDVLVTYTTDPGWTPLFVNASAIILQVGGPLQHGGVVAREYGKPCVAGVKDVYDTFKDGQIVEVDGSSGIVKIVREVD